MKALASTTLLILALTSFSLAQTELEQEVMKLMTGSFTSEAQSLEDTSYFSITLHMYPIWEGEKGNWLYVEQALSSTPDKPYRQRIYEVKVAEDGTIASSVYRVEDQDKAVGQWKTPEYFDALGKDILVEREGCTVFLRKQDDGRFKGSTNERDCKSSMLGASYATSEVEFDEKGVMSWDRGFDDSGEQVWGAEKAGYRFDRIGE